MRYDNPPTKRDRAIRVKHEIDSVKYNVRHAKDHIAEANRHVTKLKKNSPKRKVAAYKITNSTKGK